ncbi:hypothetical protein DFP72DRAFT_1136337 [Ephemerocybe angulata]|uniref:Uncharacterized protein n=1 Tax=Ephemerocybe angulata TaxID=980116 RepID=A0A8H6IDP2_9AGAR|nr:hypothetical protein DFP72DRAFT_1136337 [Tulosesus angulatus]
MASSQVHELPYHGVGRRTRNGCLGQSLFAISWILNQTLDTAATWSKSLGASGCRSLTWARRRTRILEIKQALRHSSWAIVNNVLLLQVGTTYKRRFEDFAIMSSDLDSIDQWRKDQQDEWNRLSTTLALLATMNTTILAISPQAPNLAFAAWLGGAGLSVCGVFVVQYFSIKAFSITDEDMGSILLEDNDWVALALLASVIASPVVMKLWSAVLFILGTVDYIWETEAMSWRWKILAVVPVLSGTVVMVLAAVLGWIIDRKLEEKASHFILDLQHNVLSTY